MLPYVLGLLALVAGLSTSSANNTARGRIGCYEDTVSRVWRHWNNHHDKNTVLFCKNMCQGFKYAGVRAGRECMCGNDLLPTKLPDSRCNTPCTGDLRQTCGGYKALEVFPVEPKPALLGTYVGCFRDAEDRVWKTGQIHLQRNSPQRCINACRGFRYAGVEAQHWCFCGNTVPATPLSAGSCTNRCSGEPEKSCGGIWALEVFQISETTTTELVVPATTASPCMTSCPKVVQCPACPVCPVQTPAELPVQVIACIPTDYKPHGDMGIYKLFAERKNWDDAWQQCEDDEAHLLIINSEDEAKFVRSLFAQVPSETRMHAGFHDLLRKGTYRTLFSEPLTSTGYTVWSPEYPQAPSAVKHCGCVDAQARLAQRDDNCAAQAVFVCEKKSDSPDANGRAVDIDQRGLADQGQ